MRKQALAIAVAVFAAGTFVSAQTTQQPTSPQPTGSQPQTRSTAPTGTTTTLSGCVYREQDVPGRTPNVAERAGVLEDYILAEVTPQAGSSGTAGTAGTTGTAAGTSTTGGTKTGTASGKTMYKLELVDDDRLRALVGKRVEVTGRIDAEPGDKRAPTPGATAGPADRSVGPDRIELPEFEVTSIREIAGTCPATPTKQP